MLATSTWVATATLTLAGEPVIPTVNLQSETPTTPTAPPAPPKSSTEPPAKEVAPPPRRLEGFPSGAVRLPRLPGEPAPIGTTPKPTPKVLKEFEEFIAGTIDPQNTLDLVVGQPRLLLLKQAPRRVQIADDKYASYTLITEKELSILGRDVGTTVLNLWFADPKDPTKEKILSYLLRIIPDPEARERLERAYKALEGEINRAFPDSSICLQLVGDKLVVSGQAKDMAEATQILRIVRANAPGEAARIPVDQITATLGTDPNQPPPPALSSFALAGGPNVINLIRIPGEQQVMLKVTVAEMNRSAARSIGLNFSITNNQGINVFSQLTGNVAGPWGGALGGIGAGAGGGGSGSTFNNLPAALDNGQIALAISALRQLDLARSLAEPNLVTMNGQPASFQAGGQFPVPVVTGFTAAGLQGVTFIPFGVQLSFTPYITDKDRIRLVVQAEVSTRDFRSLTMIGGAAISSLSTRNFQTTVELREGQTLAVAGLIQTTFGADASRVPGLGDLPIIGRLAAFDRTTSNEQELVILITPELVRPMEPHEVPALPGSDTFEPSDLEFYLLARIESRRSEDFRASTRTDLQRMARYRRCEDLYIIGSPGHADGHK
ncbi:MAG: pilus assembly protein N-terminal domain-containing protein [Gemmataceae bacterium]|nr:pilus assembly protein N-terminal domain-containing protein [Gemmataceae bacterium]MDW8265470.1 pilus assembly protein N-terminal domain-containing protein [Gemmataceae bacterium]